MFFMHKAIYEYCVRQTKLGKLVALVQSYRVGDDCCAITMRGIHVMVQMDKFGCLHPSVQGSLHQESTEPQHMSSAAIVQDGED